VTPGLAAIVRYERAWLNGDLVAGLTVAAYLVPQVMAYAAVAGLPAVTGLWAALPALVVYALLGTSPSLSLGPEATTALMTAIAIRPLADGNAARYAMLAASLALLVGAIAVAASLVRLGFVADLLSRPVLVGYMAGVALIMMADQLQNVTGASVTGQTFAAQLSSFARNAAQIQPVTVAVAAGVLLFLFVLSARWPKAPGPLLAVVLATVVVAAAGLEAYGVSTVGPIPAGLPTPRFPDVHASVLRDLALPALAVLIVGFTDDMLTARSFATRDTMIVANRELLALGVANAGASVLHGFPVSSSASRTAIAKAAGRRSQAYSLVVAAAVVVVLVFLHGALTHFPTAALGALVFYAAVRLIDVVAFRRLMVFRRTELAIALASCAAVLVFNILYGVLIAVGLSVADVLIRVARPHDAILGRVSGLAGMHDVDDYPNAATIPGLVVYRYDAPLFFANASNFRQRALGAADASTGPLQWFILNVEANVEVDFTALEALDDLRAEIVSRGAVFALARVKQDLLSRLTAFGLTQKIGADLLFPTLPTAVEAYQRWASDRRRS
jgi:high affinity sulfate transporter 1